MSESVLPVFSSRSFIVSGLRLDKVKQEMIRSHFRNHELKWMGMGDFKSDAIYSTKWRNCDIPHGLNTL